MTTEQDVAQHLAATIVVSPAVPGPGQLLGPVALVYDENCRIGPVQPIDTLDDGTTIPGGVPLDVVVFVLGSGGLRDEAHKGGDKADPFTWPGIQYPSCQLVVRSAPNAYGAGAAVAEVVARALDKNPPAGYFDARVADGQPWYVRERSTDDHEWSITLELKRHVPH